MRRVDHLLIGGGIAAVSCAQELRELGADGSILLVSREVDPPYERPPASKGYLRGDASKEDALLEVPEGVELLTRTSVMALDVGEKIAKLSNKEDVAYRTALVATGAMVRRLSVDGAALDGIHYLRTLPNADSIRQDAQSAQRVVLVGGSFIAVEVAASLTEMGKSCTLVMQEEEPLSTLLGTTAGKFVRGLLEARGIELIASAEVTAFAGGGDRVEGVTLADGVTVPAEMVVCGVGAIPDVMLARKAGLELGPRGGVVCDERLHASAEGVWAAGDICEYESVLHGARVRIEHFEAAAAQGKTVARNMLGADVPHDVVPYFWSDIADWATLECVGPPSNWDDEIVDGSIEKGEFSIEYMRGSKLVGCASFGGHADLDEVSARLAKV